MVLLVLPALSVMIGSTAIAPAVVWDVLFPPSADIDQFAVPDVELLAAEGVDAGVDAYSEASARELMDLTALTVPPWSP